MYVVLLYAVIPAGSVWFVLRDAAAVAELVKNRRVYNRVDSPEERERTVEESVCWLDIQDTLGTQSYKRILVLLNTVLIF